MKKATPVSHDLEANKRLVGRVYTEWWNAKGNPASVDEMVSPDFVGHPGDGSTRTFQDLKRLVPAYQKAFGGLHEIVHCMVAEGDRVAVHYTLRATHTGDYLGHKPTGKKIQVSGIEIWRIENGKIAEFWHYGEEMRL